MGLHIVADLYGCKTDKLKKVAAVKKLLLSAVRETGLTCVATKFYQFQPQGVTGMILLAESHISIHTWPEKEYVSLDIFTCNVSRSGNEERAKKAYEIIKKELAPSSEKKKEIPRD